MGSSLAGDMYRSDPQTLYQTINHPKYIIPHQSFSFVNKELQCTAFLKVAVTANYPCHWSDDSKRRSYVLAMIVIYECHSHQ